MWLHRQNAIVVRRMKRASSMQAQSSLSCQNALIICNQPTSKSTAYLQSSSRFRPASLLIHYRYVYMHRMQASHIDPMADCASAHSVGHSLQGARHEEITKIQTSDRRGPQHRRLITRHLASLLQATPEPLNCPGCSTLVYYFANYTLLAPLDRWVSC